MPSEQSAGLPNFSSDLYALGITAIEALTGLQPHALQRDKHGEILWRDKVASLNSGLANVINKMVRYDFNQRYANAQSVLKELRNLKLNGLSEESPQRITLSIDEAINREDKLPTVILPTDWDKNYKMPDATTAVDSDDDFS
ncbi:MAG: hypothetical protein F6K11_34865 [Leptolyngbya sp. SIO3F4]|nr:hypothetical protein [Leptolyngbya sp. SIO3F4]